MITAQADRGSPQLQQHEPFLVVERAFAGGARCARRVGRGRGQGPTASAAAMTLLHGRKLQVPREVQFPGGDRLIDVAPDRVNLARPRIDMRDHLAMRAPDRAHIGAAVEFRPDALAYRLVAGVGEHGLTMLADQIAYAKSGCAQRTSAINPFAPVVFRLGRAHREGVVDVGAVGVGEPERVLRDARLPYHVAHEGC